MKLQTLSVRNCLFACILIIFPTLPHAASSAEGEALWVKQAIGAGPEESHAQGGGGVAVDTDGNVLVTAGFWESATFGLGEANETTLVPAGSWDVFIAKYAADGTLLWARQAGGTLADWGNGIAVDAAGNALVTGYFSVSATFGVDEDNETTLVSAGSRDIFIAKYAPDGNLLWARQAKGTGGDIGHGIAVDAAGNALVTGEFGTYGDSVTFGLDEDNETTLVSAGSDDIFIAKYAPDGSLVWARQAGGTEWDNGNGIAMDAVGNILVTGYFGDSATFGLDEANETTLVSAGSDDIFIAKYAPDGSLVWVRQVGGIWVDWGSAIAVDAAGNTLVTGHFRDSVTFGLGEANETTLVEVSLDWGDVFVAKYTPDGSLAWARQYGGEDRERGLGIAAGAAGNVLVTGFSGVDEGDAHIFIAEYAPDGNLLWARQAGPSLPSAGKGIAVDAAGNALVTGTLGSDIDVFIAKIETSESVSEFTVNIDIIPGERHNTINPRSRGSVWVAVLSDTEPEPPFDPSSQADIRTVEFGPDGAMATRYGVKDINRDGLGDLLLRFEIRDTGIACGDTEATLTGETFDGVSFTGTDAIKTVGCRK